MRHAVRRLIANPSFSFTAAITLAAAIGALPTTSITSRHHHVCDDPVFGVSPLDPVTYGAGVAALSAVALLATWLPARQATRVDPAVALRGG